MAEIDRLALELLREAKANPARPVNVNRLVLQLIGTRLRSAPMRTGREGALVRVRDEWRVYLSDTLPLPRARWVAAHEVAHWAFRRCGREVSERACDALGAALVAPVPLYDAVRKRTHDVRTVADAMGTTMSVAALREGEVTGRPVALVASSKIVLRGRTWGWPDEREIRRVARVGAAHIVRVRIDDEPDRIALMAA